MQLPLATMPAAFARMGVVRHGADPALASECIPIGVLFSVDGPYSVVSRSMLNGALLAVEEMNARADARIMLRPVVVNPAGDLTRYKTLCTELLSQGLKHVVGCYTSSSRKEVIPLFEKADALLWYPSHYEGFECSANVIYTGAVANQHLLPLADYLLEQCGRTAFCVGSNYIWAWENNRILRERLAVSHGRIVTERYFAVGDTDFAQVIAAILQARPAFVFNTLIGDSSYRFLCDFRAACRARGIDQAKQIPVASCTLSEPELEAIGPDAADGHITASVYFSSVTGSENVRFVEAYAARFPGGPTVCADAEAAYLATRLLALALESAGGSTDVAAIQQAVTQLVVKAPQGEVWIDPETLHAALTPRIGRSTRDARFEIVSQAPQPVRPDPYLVWNSPRYGAASSPPTLRVAS
jgi:ABC-type branched-subunit amino acid transport system substrate-binding protein